MRSEILLLRSGRHLSAACEALRNAYPGCRISVVGQPGTEELLTRCGIPVEDQLIYRAGKVFSPFRFRYSETGRAVRRRTFDRVAVLWTNPTGEGFDNVDRTALLLSPRGFLAIPPDGSLLTQVPLDETRRTVRMVFWSLLALSTVFVFLVVPATVGRLVVGPKR